jgi:O-antigen ligase
MNVRLWFAAETWRLDGRLWFLIAVTFAGYLAFLVSTPTTLYAIACFVAAVAAGHLRDGTGISVTPVPDWLKAGGLLAAYILVSSVWTFDVKSTVLTGLLIAGLLAVAHIGTLSLARAPALWLEHITRTMLVAYIVALLYFIIDELTVLAFQKAILWPFHAVRLGGATGIWFDRATVVDVPYSSIKWRMPPLGFLLWPALLICTLQLKDAGVRTVRTVQAALLGVAAWMIWYAGHRTSFAALVVAVAIFAMAAWNPARTRQVLGLAWVAAFIVIIPLATMLFSLSFHKDKRVGKLDSRIVIWAYTAEQIKTHPLLGIGAVATNNVNTKNLEAVKAAHPELFQPQNSDQPNSGHPTYDMLRSWFELGGTGSIAHAHNIFLQSWFELGALGTCLLAAFGLCVLHASALAPSATQPYLQAAFAAVAVTTGASFGLFEPWFMGTFVMCALSCVMAVTYHRRLQPSPPAGFSGDDGGRAERRAGGRNRSVS